MRTRGVAGGKWIAARLCGREAGGEQADDEQSMPGHEEEARSGVGRVKLRAEVGTWCI
jgi:hypothetical protein